MNTNTVKSMIGKKEKGAIVENMLVALLGMVMATAFLVIIMGSFKSINDRWMMEQTAREYMLLMETEGYLTVTDASALISTLEDIGIYDISLSGTTRSQVPYGQEIVLSIHGKYDSSVLSFAGGISKVAETTRDIAIERLSTAKQ